jgi:hypothetical protein
VRALNTSSTERQGGEPVVAGAPAGCSVVAAADTVDDFRISQVAEMMRERMVQPGVDADEDLQDKLGVLLQQTVEEEQEYRGMVPVFRELWEREVLTELARLLEEPLPEEFILGRAPTEEEERYFRLRLKEGVKTVLGMGEREFFGNVDNVPALVRVPQGNPILLSDPAALRGILGEVAKREMKGKAPQRIAHDQALRAGKLGSDLGVAVPDSLKKGGIIHHFNWQWYVNGLRAISCSVLGMDVEEFNGDENFPAFLRQAQVFDEFSLDRDIDWVVMLEMGKVLKELMNVRQIYVSDRKEGFVKLAQTLGLPIPRGLRIGGTVPPNEYNEFKVGVRSECRELLMATEESFRKLMNMVPFFVRQAGLDEKLEI